MKHDNTVQESGTDARPWSRRRFLGSSGALGAMLFAGCIGGGGDGNGAPGDGNSPTTGSGNGQPGIPSDVSGVVGQLLTGNSLQIMIEYVRPIETVTNYSSFPRTDDEEVYGQVRTIDDYTEIRLAPEGSSLHGVGVAMKNTADHLIDVSSMFLRLPAGMVGQLPDGPDQRRNMTSEFRGTGRFGGELLPGEFLRAEVVFPIVGDPGDYVFLLQTLAPGRRSERLAVDLGAGSEGQAPFSQEAKFLSVGQTGAVGDLEMTLHSVEYVESVTDSPYQDIWGAREGYDYLMLDVSATRVSDVMIGQSWVVGFRDTDGYGHVWGTIYEDVYDLNRPMLDELDVGETTEHTVLAFPIVKDFRPAFVSMTAPGKLANPTQQADEGKGRALWQVA